MKPSQAPYKIIERVRAPFPPASEQEVQEIERTVGSRLPEDYRHFLLTINGIDARPVFIVVPLLEHRGKDLFDIAELYTTYSKADELDRILPCQSNYEFDKRVPKRFLLIGRSGGGQGYCISLSDEDRGWVYHWSPPGDDESLESERWLFPVGKSFRHFWERTRVATDDDYQ